MVIHLSGWQFLKAFHSGHRSLIFPAANSDHVIFSRAQGDITIANPNIVEINETVKKYFGRFGDSQKWDIFYR